MECCAILEDGKKCENSSRFKRQRYDLCGKHMRSREIKVKDTRGRLIELNNEEDKSLVLPDQPKMVRAKSPVRNLSRRAPSPVRNRIIVPPTRSTLPVVKRSVSTVKQQPKKEKRVIPPPMIIQVSSMMTLDQYVENQIGELTCGVDAHRTYAKKVMNHLSAGGEIILRIEDGPDFSRTYTSTNFKTTKIITLKNEGEPCAVCQDDCHKNEKVRHLPCGHEFHLDCIDPWLNKNNTCPTCRRAV